MIDTQHITGVVLAGGRRQFETWAAQRWHVPVRVDDAQAFANADTPAGLKQLPSP